MRRSSFVSALIYSSSNHSIQTSIHTSLEYWPLCMSVCFFEGLTPYPFSVGEAWAGREWHQPHRRRAGDHVSAGAQPAPSRALQRGDPAAQAAEAHLEEPGLRRQLSGEESHPEGGAREAEGPAAARGGQTSQWERIHACGAGCSKVQIWGVTDLRQDCGTKPCRGGRGEGWRRRRRGCVIGHRSTHTREGGDGNERDHNSEVKDRCTVLRAGRTRKMEVRQDGVQLPPPPPICGDARFTHLRSMRVKNEKQAEEENCCLALNSDQKEKPARSKTPSKFPANVLRPSPNSPADAGGWTPSCGFHSRTFSEGTKEESIYSIVVVSVFLLFCTVLSFTRSKLYCVCVWAVVYQDSVKFCVCFEVSILSWLYFSRSALFTSTFPLRLQTASLSTCILP